MDDQRLIMLLEKVLAGKASDTEKLEVEAWYSEMNNREVIWETASPDEEKKLEAAMLAHIGRHIEAAKSKGRIFRLPHWTRIAAAITLFLSAGGGIFYLATRAPSVAGQAGSAVSLANAGINKYISLPDGSHLLLHPGSKVSYDFSGKTRELNLSGEAYFDVKHENEHPFVIHTGNVTTIVLGTAFNIKAYAGQGVVVTVTRGKVSVSDETKKIAAVLTPDQQAEYNEQSRSVKKETVNSAKEVAWISADMQFDELTFSALAEKLSERYGVNFEFKNPGLQSCPITGRFTGDESLDEVLKIISQTTSTSYSINSGKVIIDGKSCTSSLTK